jgi:5-methylcytosine-specific restriction endonuclease McrA
VPQKLNPNITPEQRAEATEKMRKWRLENPQKVKESLGRANDARVLKYQTQQDYRAKKIEAARKYREEHPEWVAESNERRKETGREYWRAYHEAHREKEREYMRQRRKDHPEIKEKRPPRGLDLARDEKQREYARERWRKRSDEEKQEHYAYCRKQYAKDIQKSREKLIVKTNRRRARKNSATGSYTVQQIAELFIKQGKKCAVCKTAISDKSGKTKFHIDHVIPLAKKGSNSIENLALLCPRCNHSKNAKDPYEWAQKKHGKLFF